MENLLSIKDKIKAKKIAEATEELSEYIREFPDLIPVQIELSKEMHKDGGDDPVKRMQIIKEKMEKLNSYLGEIENALKPK